MSACNSAEDPGSGHPGFQPYATLRNALLGLATADWVARCNALAGRRALRSEAGAPIGFVVAAPAADALDYEAAILHQGRIACRPGGRGALHDLHNALVWLTFPQVKATLNRLHVAMSEAALPGAVQEAARGRGRVRDVVTLLDESGLLWVSTSRHLDRQLKDRQWHHLLVSRRKQVRASVLPIVIGHGLLEKLAAPYKAMTAHCLICPWPGSSESNLDQGPIDIAATGGAAAGLARSDFAAIDTVVAKQLRSAFEAGRVPSLAPLPMLGLPGWDPGNLDASYYDDARVFRAPQA